MLAIYPLFKSVSLMTRYIFRSPPKTLSFENNWAIGSPLFCLHLSCKVQCLSTILSDLTRLHFRIILFNYSTNCPSLVFMSTEHIFKVSFLNELTKEAISKSRFCTNFWLGATSSRYRESIACIWFNLWIICKDASSVALSLLDRLSRRKRHPPHYGNYYNWLTKEFI